MLFAKIVLCIALFVVFSAMAIVPMLMEYKEEEGL